MLHLFDWQVVDSGVAFYEAFLVVQIFFYQSQSSLLVGPSTLPFVDSNDGFAVHLVCCDTIKLHIISSISKYRINSLSKITKNQCFIKHIEIIP